MFCREIFIVILEYAIENGWEDSWQEKCPADVVSLLTVNRFFYKVITASHRFVELKWRVTLEKVQFDSEKQLLFSVPFGRSIFRECGDLLVFAHFPETPDGFQTVIRKRGQSSGCTGRDIYLFVAFPEVRELKRWKYDVDDSLLPYRYVWDFKGTAEELYALLRSAEGLPIPTRTLAFPHHEERINVFNRAFVRWYQSGRRKPPRSRQIYSIMNTGTTMTPWRVM
jgi:hypothetical protein